MHLSNFCFKRNRSLVGWHFLGTRTWIAKTTQPSPCLYLEQELSPTEETNTMVIKIFSGQLKQNCRWRRGSVTAGASGQPADRRRLLMPAAGTAPAQPRVVGPARYRPQSVHPAAAAAPPPASAPAPLRRREVAPPAPLRRPPAPSSAPGEAAEALGAAAAAVAVGVIDG